MNDWDNWFRKQLKLTAEGMIWAIKQIAPDYYFRLPPDPAYMGTWPPARHIWHVARYEHLFALPAMKVWLGEPLVLTGSIPHEEGEWVNERDTGLEAFIAELQLIREKQLALLKHFSYSDWSRTAPTFWGERPLTMVLTKTYQHTLEHTDALLRMGLWWEPNPAKKKAG